MDARPFDEEKGGAGLSRVGTVTLLTADVDDASRLREADPSAMADIAARLRSVVDDVVPAHEGTFDIDDAGDEVVAGFRRPLEAIACALSLQRSVDRDASGSGPLVRVAIHVASSAPGDNDSMRMAVERCARLRDVAHGGQILLTRAARDLVVDRLPDDAALLDLGTVRLRDLSRPDRVYQVLHPDVRSESPPLRSLDAVANNLPVQLTRFVGRKRECTTVAGLVAANALVTLTGAGGCGKTRMALQVAADLVDDNPDGVWWVDLAKLADGRLLPNAVASALSIKETAGESLVETIQVHLRDRRVSLVLDNCEHLAESCAELVHELLAACPSLSILATSREILGVEGEVPWRVPSLTLPEGGRQAAIESVRRSEAVRLFLSRATTARPTFTLTDENAPAVAEICRRLDGMPLAIELAAARARMMSPEQILDGLSDRFLLLAGGSRTAHPRLRALRASVDWSYELLTEQDRVVLRRLAVFAGRFTLEAAESVCSGRGLTQEAVFEGVSRLVDRSLVQVGDDDPEARYALLETIRQYALERLSESGETEAVRDRHLRFFVELAERAGQEMRVDAADWLTRIETELDNVRAAFDWSVRSSRSNDALRLMSALWIFWMVRGHLTEGRRRFEVALAAEDADPRLRAMALVGVGQLMANHGDLDATGRFAREALAIARTLGDELLEGRALDTLGYSIAFLDPAAAPKAFGGAVSLLRKKGDMWFLADALNGLGIARYFLGDYAAARASLEEGVECSRAAGSSSTLTIGLGVLGYTLGLQGHLRRGEECLREALELARRLDDRVWLAQALYGLGFVEAHRGEYDSAESHVAESVQIGRHVSPMILSWALLTQGLVRFMRSSLVGSASALEEALALSRVMGPPWLSAWALSLLANTARLQGNLDGANLRLEEALALTRSGGGRIDVLFDARGRLLRAVGEADRAEALHHEAIAAAREAESVLLVPTQLEALAGLAALGGSSVQAARLFGAAEAAREGRGLVRYPIGRQEYEADVGVVRAGLSDEEFRTAWEQGRAMSLDEAVAYASRGRGRRRRPASGWASLTPTELEVVRHVTSGLTNPQIAEQLFVSRSTVKQHLNHIFTKLGISTRAELASAATLRGASRGGRA